MHAIRRRGRFAAAASTLLLSAVLLGLSPDSAAADEDEDGATGQPVRRGRAEGVIPSGEAE